MNQETRQAPKGKGGRGTCSNQMVNEFNKLLCETIVEQIVAELAGVQRTILFKHPIYLSIQFLANSAADHGVARREYSPRRSLTFFHLIRNPTPDQLSDIDVESSGQRFPTGNGIHFQHKQAT